MRRVDVELIGLGIVRHPVGSDVPALGYRLDRTELDNRLTPDQQAREMSVVAAIPAEVLHSTSWRHEDDGTVVLTYAVAPVAPETDLLTPLPAPAIVCSGDPLRPAPGDLHTHHVAAHAARHLAYLLDRDPGIAEGVRRSVQPEFWALLHRTGEPPTDTHRATHRRADSAALQRI